MTKDLAIIMCPPHPQYKEPPADISHCELRDCPKCDNKMWLSEKKKGAIALASCLGKDILLGCYDCIKKLAEDNPTLFTTSQRVDI